MSRPLKRSSFVWTLLPAIAVACSPESPVAPGPAEPEEEVLEGRAEPTPPAPQAVPNEFIVILRDDRPLPPGLVQQLVGDHDLALKHEYEHVLRGFSARVPPQALAGLQNNPFVAKIAPNLTYTLETPSTTRAILAPIDVPTDGLRVRLVANDLGPGDVGLWPNRGSETDAVQPDAARQPTYRGPDAAFGGQASIGFNEGNDDDEVLEIPGVTSHASATVIAVLRQEDAKPHDYVLGGMYGSGNSRAALVSQFTRGKKVEYWDTSSGSSSGTTKLNNGQTYVVSWRVDAGNIVEIHVDGVPAGSGALSAPIPSFDRYLLGMGEPASADRFDGRVGEILVYDRVLADCERAGVVEDLGAYYGVAVSGSASCEPQVPADPTGLTAAGAGTTGIDLSWTDASSDEDGFRIERRLGQDGAWAQIAETAADQVSHSDSGLEAATEYCYRVAAFNGDGASGYSNAACAATDPAPSPPADPTGLSAAAAGTTGIDLSWTDASSDEDGFRIERRLGQDGAWAQIAETAADQTSYSDSGLEAGTEYCYHVAAFNGDGVSNSAGPACAVTDVAGSLPAPIDVPTAGLRVRLIANDLPGGEVASWPNRGSEADAVQADANRLPVYHAPSSVFGDNASVGFNEGSDNDEALEVTSVAHHGSGTLITVFSQEGTESHNYGIFGAWGSGSSRAGMVTRSYSTGGPLDYWDSRNAWVNGNVTLVGGQAYVGAWRIAGGQTVDLQVNGGAAGTKSIGSDFPGFDRYVIGMTEPSTSARFDGQVAELLFYDRALADCELDQIVADLGSRYAVSVSATGGGCNPPPDPTGLTAAASGTSSIALSWTDASANEDGFRIERRLGQDGAWAQIAETAADQTSYADSGLEAGTDYCYRVAAFNAEGVSNWAGPACAVTDAAGPLPAPIDVPSAGLRVRLIANDLPGGEVASWPNRGSEADAAQADANRLPVYHAPSSLFGENASVGFNEGSDNDEALEVTGVAHHGSGTLIMVFSQEGTESHNYGLFGAWGSGSSRAGMVTRSYSTGGPLDYWDSSNAWVNGNVTLVAGQAYVGAWRIAGGQTADLQVNGGAAGSKSIGSGFPGFDRYVIGMTEPSTSARFDGQVAELLFYDRALVDCELDQIVADLGSRYDVSVSATGGGCNPPADPTDLTATVVGYDGIDLAWTDASANEDGFRIERRLGQDGAWEEIATTGPDATSYESRSLIQQTEYCYRVSAFNGDGNSAFTDAACATTEAAPEGACVDTGNHDDLSDLYGIAAIGAPANQAWASTQQAGCEIAAWYFGIDSGVDSDHPDLNVVEALSFVAAEPGHDGEDRNGHGTHTAGTAAARDGNGGVVGVAPGARIHSFRVCEDSGSCQTADMVAAMDAVMARKLDNPGQPIVANMSIGGPADEAIDEALRNSVNAGIVYAVAAGNGVFGACIFPADAANVSPARVGDDEILPNGKSKSNAALHNGVLTTTSHNASFADVNCNYGAPVSVAAPGYEIRSTWLDGGYNTISGTSMASPHAAGAALLYLQSHPNATPAEVEAAVASRLQRWTTNESPNASGRLYVDGL